MLETSSAHVEIDPADVHCAPVTASPRDGEGAEKPDVTQQKKPSVLGKLNKWAGYESCCRGPVAPARFLPMKTPLSEVASYP